MINIDDIDRKIIARLQIDGRASVTTLAAVLGLARGTVQTHELVRAVMMIEVRGNTANSVQKALQRLPEVTSLHRTCGVWDLVIELETTSLYEFDSILSRIRELPGVSNSETCPLLRRIS